MFQKSLTQGPAPTTTCSHSIIPLSVSTPVTALLLLPLLNPVTFTPLTMLTPFVTDLLSRAFIESLLNAYPPFFREEQMLFLLLANHQTYLSYN